MAKTRGKRTDTTVTTPVGDITGGVDTHLDFHVAAAKDALGRTLGTARFPATAAGYAALQAWLTGFGPLALVGAEGTGSYGAGLTAHLTDRGVPVVEINRPDRRKRRLNGKSDPQDAINAAAAAQAGENTATPKPRTGPVESVRVLRIARDQLVTARTAAINTLRALIVTAPAGLRETLHGLGTTALLTHCATLAAPPLPAPRPGDRTRNHTAAALAAHLLDSTAAVHTALGELARQIRFHDTGIRDLDTTLDALVRRIAPRTTALHGLGTHTTAQLLVTAGDHPDRLHGEPAFATLTGTAPQDCSSGRQQHHRLSRAGDRQANAALHRVTVTRLATHQPTRTYLRERLRPGTKMTKKHLIRCLKRYLAREIYPHLMADLADLAKPPTTT
jgi:transposase